MELNTSFKLATYTALAGWVALIGLPSWGQGHQFVLFIVVVLLGSLYGYVLQNAMKLKSDPGADKPSFFTLRGVIALFQKPESIVAAWIHILAFDLMVALYIRSEGTSLEISHWALIPCYLLTMMFGPLGLLLFLGVRWFAFP